jgi:hypothetical protein
MITDRMYLGSADTLRLMMGLNTRGHHALLREFVSGERPHYNALASPIEALRTGVILEKRYGVFLGEEYTAQVRVQCAEMDVFRASLDFARFTGGAISSFHELKCVQAEAFQMVHDAEDRLKYVRSHYKPYWQQVQQQLLCTGLPAANLVFLAVYTYDDYLNHNRDIQAEEVIRVTVPRDEDAIAAIKERGRIFQQIRDTYRNA